MDPTDRREPAKRGFRWRARLKRAGVAILVFGGFVWAVNTSLFSKRPPGRAKLLAHRGLHQTFEIEGLKWDSNTAAMIHQPEHLYLENTIPSMRAAFAAGADMIEFDVQLTRDLKLAVFHDFLLEYRTNGSGPIAEASMEELRKLDVGFGYTADGGMTYPFRGKGTGLMVSIEDVFEEFPDNRFLIHIKGGGNEAGEILVDVLGSRDPNWIDGIGVYGSEDAIAAVKDSFPGLKSHSMGSLREELISYELLGWTGYVPSRMRGSQLQIPLQYAKYLWGWPRKFLNRMDGVGTRVILVSGDGRWSEGFDSESDLGRIPEEFNGFVWSNRAERIAKSERFRRSSGRILD